MPLAHKPGFKWSDGRFDREIHDTGARSRPKRETGKSLYPVAASTLLWAGGENKPPIRAEGSSDQPRI